MNIKAMHKIPVLVNKMPARDAILLRLRIGGILVYVYDGKEHRYIVKKIDPNGVVYLVPEDQKQVDDFSKSDDYRKILKQMSGT